VRLSTKSCQTSGLVPVFCLQRKVRTPRIPTSLSAQGDGVAFPSHHLSIFRLLSPSRDPGDRIFRCRDLSTARRLASALQPAHQDKAIEQIDTADKARAAFVRQYLGLKWPEANLYDIMFNTEGGDSFVADILVRCVQQVAGDVKNVAIIPNSR